MILFIIHAGPGLIYATEAFRYFTPTNFATNLVVTGISGVTSRHWLDIAYAFCLEVTNELIDAVIAGSV